jgi:GT2 family glycosyltransferase
MGRRTPAFRAVALRNLVAENPKHTRRMSTARVTIGIPCFNAERWIGASVESALAQTWPDKEVIVVDDGSRDGSLAILEKFGTAIRLIRSDHRGGNHARNEALRHATGDWLQFLDADDYLEPEKLAQQFAETDGGAAADVIYSPTWIEDVRTGHREPSAIDTTRDLYVQWITWQLPQTGGCLWRKSALDALGGWKEDQPCCQEHELYLRALQAGQRFVFAATPHAVYRLWSEETVCRRDPRMVIRLRTALIDALQSWMQEQGLWQDEHRRAAGRACFEMSRTLAKTDLRTAAAYHRDRAEHGLIHVSGPAAPSFYRLAHRVLGFSGAERLAAARRSRNP